VTDSRASDASTRLVIRSIAAASIAQLSQL
jgi:hypothetical protein